MIEPYRNAAGSEKDGDTISRHHRTGMIHLEPLTIGENHRKRPKRATLK